ncbi:hypothetical protein BV898_14829 [Hypsibius exemplaris]|uniref:Uncharacterized protein n=1 Tax=Hypsibius exemplaris TaxID=2072580 RepID=A0A9X6NBP2_HYPEX|nr:hypothetical protein BV898_14829 [Hypsibius exemplaris]
MASEGEPATAAQNNVVLLPQPPTNAKGYPEVNPKITLGITHFGVHYIMQDHPLKIGSVGYVPPRRTEIPLDSYYNTPNALRKILKDDPPSQYGYDQKSRHENRKHNRHHCLHIQKEEDSRPVPLLSSSEIGRYWKEDATIDIYKFPRPHIPSIQQEFYSRNGVVPEEMRPQLRPVAGSQQVNITVDDKKFYK